MSLRIRAITGDIRSKFIDAENICRRFITTDLIAYDITF